MNTTFKTKSARKSFRGNQHRPYTPRPLVNIGRAFDEMEKALRERGRDVTKLIEDQQEFIRQQQQLRHATALNLEGF